MKRERNQKVEKNGNKCMCSTNRSVPFITHRALVIAWYTLNKWGRKLPTGNQGNGSTDEYHQLK